MNGALMRAVKSLCKNGKAYVTVSTQKEGQGVRQGCTMSQWLFSNLMDNMVREAKQEFNGGVEIKVGAMQLHLFEDDLMLGWLELVQLPK